MTSDGWSRKNLRGVYCNTLTAHSISDDWKLEQFVLDVSDLNKQHTIVNLIAEWQRVTSDYNLGNILAVVCDGASDYSGAAKQFGKYGLWCVCHRLHLVSQKLFVRERGTDDRDH